MENNRLNNTIDINRFAMSATIVAAAVTVAPTAFPFAYEPEAARTGLVLREYHAAQLPRIEVCSPDCLIVSDRESQLAWWLTNPTGGLGAMPVEDNITPITDASGNVVNLELILFSAASSLYSWNEIEFVAALGMEWIDFDLTTDPSGKIIGGWTQQFVDGTPVGEEVSCALYDFDNRRSYSFNAPVPLDTCNITIAEARDHWLNGATLPHGAVLYDVRFQYVTCDTTSECGQQSKSVSVPGFAAAALGLGLVGVTILTGSRKVNS